MISQGGLSAKKTLQDNELDSAPGDLIAEAAFCVHGELGPGLSQSVYYECFERELKHMKVNFERNVAFTIKYRKKTIRNAFIADFVVNNKALIMIRAEDKSAKHDLEIRSFLKHSGLSEAYILNFRAQDMREGIVKANYRPGWIDARKAVN
jgi:GxxExxY protein